MQIGKPIYNEGTGVIKELKFVDGEAVFVLADGKEIKPGNISSILGGDRQYNDSYHQCKSICTSKSIDWTNGSIYKWRTSN